MQSEQLARRPPEQGPAAVRAVAARIVARLFQQRRLLASADQEAPDFEREAAVHLARVERFVAAGEAVELILPAFPAKSPNRSKVLGVLPDLGEELAMAALDRLCADIGALYAPGARVTICSDGRVFADLVHIPDADVSAYKQELIHRIGARYPDSLAFFDLDDVFAGGGDFGAMREELMMLYGEPLRSLKERCRIDPAAGAMYRGICRFLLDDFTGLAQFSALSRTGVQQLARGSAYRVIQRSNAWSRLLEQHFTHAVRLSIHPQPRVSGKIGVFLVDSSDVWRTPWHSVAIKRDGAVQLVPRHEAEAANALLVFEHGRPSHYIASAAQLTELTALERAIA